MWDFTGKSLLLTGAAGGIGRAIAVAFFDAGASLLLTYLAEGALQTFARSLDASGARVAALAGDVVRPDDNDRAVALCVGNATLAACRPFTGTTGRARRGPRRS